MFRQFSGRFTYNNNNNNKKSPSVFANESAAYISNELSNISDEYNQDLGIAAIVISSKNWLWLTHLRQRIDVLMKTTLLGVKLIEMALFTEHRIIHTPQRQKLNVIKTQFDIKP